MREYAGFEKRQRILEKQGRTRNEISLHLMQNRREQEKWEWEAGNEAEEEVSA